MRSTAHLLRLGAAVALLGLLLAGLAALTWADNARNRGITFTPDPQPIPWTSGPQIGVNAYNIQFEVEPAKVTRTLEMARDLGAQYVRMQLPWQDVEISGKGDFWDHKFNKNAWAKYDFLFGDMQRLGMEPIVRIDRPPDWARKRVIATPAWQAGAAFNGNSSGPPDKYADYADFVAAVAQRYRGQVRFIQIWNEPNLQDEWNWQTPDPAQFLDLLRQAAAAARAANPDVVILFPSLAPTDGLDPRAPQTELEYLDTIYKLGGKPYFDIMSGQAYGLGQAPDKHRYVRLRQPFNWRRPLDTRADVSRLPLLREVMERNGDGARPIWISEFGYTSAPPGLPATWGPPVSEAQKGAYIVGQIERARREWPWVGVMNVWMLRWGGPDPTADDPTPYFALVDRDFNPLPAYTALQHALAAPVVAGVGAHAATHPAVQAEGGGHVLRFDGTALALRGAGVAHVRIDGGALTTTTLNDAGVVVAQGLADRTHTAQISGAAPTVYIVARARPLAWLWTYGAAALLFAIAATGAVIGRAVAG